VGAGEKRLAKKHGSQGRGLGIGGRYKVAGAENELRVCIGTGKKKAGGEAFVALPHTGALFEVGDNGKREIR